MTVTKIEEVTKAKCRIEIDQEFAFVLYKGELRMYHIREGEELDPAIYEEIVGKLLPKRATMRAMNLLKSRPYTEYQLRQKLSMGGYPQDAQEEAISYVKSYHYIDDHRYAVNYLNSRGKVRSSRQVEQELLYKKGVSKAVLEAAREEAEPQDEREQIRRWMEKKHIDPAAADQSELRRFYQFLMRRGFRSSDILTELLLDRTLN